MYPDLKNFRKEINSEGPWIIIGSYSWFLFTAGLIILQNYLITLDDEFNNAF